MKKINLYVFTTLALIVGACGDFGNTNVSPNGSTAPLTSALLTNALSNIGNTTAYTLPGLYAQYFSETLYTDASRYSVQDVDWTIELAGREPSSTNSGPGVVDLQSIIDINKDPKTAGTAGLQGSNNNQIAIARIIKAYRFSVLTDRYGDMPYFDALNGNSQPKYDPQQAIYADLFKELAAAVAQFDNGAPIVGDILFGGDITRWKQFANSWRLILALRISKADATLGAAQASAAIAANGGVLASNADNIVITYPGNSVQFSNPWFSIAGDYNVCTTIANLLNTTQDDRRFAFGKAVGGILTGVPPGLPRQDAIDYTSALANANHSLILAGQYRGATGSVNILTYADVALARAEAAELGWIPGGATEASAQYAAGIAASWDRWSQTNTANLANYMGRPEVSLAAAGSRMGKINLQRWLSFYPNGAQGWSEWRRTGVPALTPSPSPVNTSGQIPVRYIYPTVEYGLNLANVTAALTGLNKGDTQDSKVWWNK
jgi:Starch-binding associating with outer membrane